MAVAHTTIASADKAAGAPVSTTLINALDLNVQAFAEGNAPFTLHPNAQGLFATGNYIIFHSDVNDVSFDGSTFVPRNKPIFIPRSGVVKVRIAGYTSLAGNAARFQVLVNGVATGTIRSTVIDTATVWDENFTVTAGDIIDVQSAEDGAGAAVWTYIQIRVASSCLSYPAATWR